MIVGWLGILVDVDFVGDAWVCGGWVVCGVCFSFAYFALLLGLFGFDLVVWVSCVNFLIIVGLIDFRRLVRLYVMFVTFGLIWFID